MIDTSNWKEFILGDLFALVNSKAYHTKDITETSSEDGLLYVTRSKFNNGIKCRVESKTEYIVNPSGTISFGAENADFFYQTEKYITGNKMYYIDTRNISEKAALFFKGVLEATFTKNFSFSDGMVPDRIRGEIVKLPVTPTGEPDWEYMESYMKNIMEESEERIENLRKADNRKHLIDTSNWKEFVLGDLFALVNSKAYHTKDITETSSEDGLLYVTRSKFNNGIKCCVESNEKYIVNPSGTISFGAENADFFYQTEKYITGNKMYYIDTQYISEMAALFFKGVLEATFTKNFSFSDGMVPDRIRGEIVKLPATPTGEPDWEYMEEYMKNVEEDVKEKVNMLSI